jgi:propanol-preferring alcohol dehydrogenase
VLISSGVWEHCIALVSRNLPEKNSSMRMMKAAVLRDFQKGIQIEEIPVPIPKPNQVLVRILASGLCQTDLHAIKGTWEKKPLLPLIPGHEGAGVVESVGAKVSGILPGQKVLIPWVGRTCHTCHSCESGFENLCEKQMNTGYVLPGTHAEYAVADYRHVILIPEEMDSVQAAPLACAGITAYQAIQTAANLRKDAVLITGVGGVGHLAVQYAKNVFSKVYALDTSEAHIKMAADLGAESYDVNEWSHMEVRSMVDAAIVCVGNAQALQESFRAVRNGGTLVVLGLGKESLLTLPWFETVTRAVKVIGSYVGPMASLQKVIQLHQNKNVRVNTQVMRLNEITDALDILATGKNQSARMVLVPSGS